MSFVTSLVSSLKGAAGTIAADKATRRAICQVRGEIKDAFEASGVEVSQNWGRFLIAMEKNAIKAGSESDRLNFYRQTLAELKTSTHSGSAPAGTIITPVEKSGVGALPVSLAPVSAHKLSGGAPAASASTAVIAGAGAIPVTVPSAAAPAIGAGLFGLERATAVHVHQAQASAKRASGSRAAATSSVRPTLGQLNEIADKVFRCEFPGDVDRENHEAMFWAIERIAWQRHLSVPTMASDADLSKKFWRPSAEQMQGMLRVEKATRQKQIDAILAD